MDGTSPGGPRPQAISYYRALPEQPHGSTPHRGSQHQVIQRLLAELEALPGQRPVSLHVLQLLDSPTTDADDIAQASAADPSLATRLLRLANSSYYGLSGRVATLDFAVTVIGFESVRAIAAATAAGADGTSSTAPAGFWARAAVTGVAASLVARSVGARPTEALCTGLLHDLGQVLLHRCDPAGYRALLEEHGAAPVSLCVAERERYGLSHDAAARRVLAAWNFPTRLLEAISGHHDPDAAEHSALARSLALGRQIAAEAIDGVLPADAVAYDVLSEGVISLAAVGNLVEQVQSEAALLLRALAA